MLLFFQVESMAAKEISDLIDRGRKILGLQKRLIDKKNEIKISLDNKIEEIRKHRSDCNLAHSPGAAISTGGVLAVATFNPVGIVVGVPIVAVGKLISYVTDCTDEIKSKSFIKKAMESVASQERLVENLKKELDDFQEFLKTIREKKTLKLTKRFGGQLSSLVQSTSDTHGSPPTGIDGLGLGKIFIDKCNDVKAVKDFVDVLNMKTLGTLELIIKGGLVALFVIKDIVNIMQSWKSTHPTEEVILGIRERLVESIKTLERLSEDLEKNVSKPSKAFFKCKAITTTKSILYTKILSLDNVHTAEFLCRHTH